MIIRTVTLFLALLLAAPVQAHEIIFIGDSIMDWNGPK